MNILFLCTHNVGRSQMAAALYNKLAKNGHADSAGTAVHHPSQTLRERAQQSEGARFVLDVMEEEGIDLRDNVRTQCTQELLSRYDHIVVMAERDTWPPFLKEGETVEHWLIADPRFKGLDATRRARDEIKQRVVRLLA